MPWLGEGWPRIVTTTPPPPPSGLPWVPAVPGVTNFNPTSEQLWTGIDGKQFSNHTPDKAWSLTSPDAQTVRFETRSGDQWYWDIEQQTGSSHNSCQLVSETPVGSNFTVQYEFMIEPGPLITSWFFVIDQIQTNPGGTPPFYLGIEDNKYVCRIATNQSTWIYPFRDTVNIIRGHWYQIQFTINFTAGFLDVIRDDVLIVNRRAAFGYAAGGGMSYQIGIYRNDVPETVVLSYRNMKITPGF